MKTIILLRHDTSNGSVYLGHWPNPRNGQRETILSQDDQKATVYGHDLSEDDMKRELGPFYKMGFVKEYR